MKKIFILGVIVFAIATLKAQTPAINPVRVVTGVSMASLPSDYEAQNAALFMQKKDWAGPFAKWDNGTAAFTISLANNAGAFGAIQNNDVVLRPQGVVKNVFFNLGTNNEFNTRRFRFGDLDNKTILVVANGGKVGINTETFPKAETTYRLYVKGGIKAEQIRVELCNGWCDYVFDKNYKLNPLSEVETFVNQNKHLPNMPSAQKLYKEEGFEIGNMITLQQEKIEEIFLHLIQFEKEIKVLKSENESLKKKLAESSSK